jgi:hypothetical protein
MADEPRIVRFRFEDSLNHIYESHRNRFPRTHGDYVMQTELPRIHFHPALPEVKLDRPLYEYLSGNTYRPVVLDGWNVSKAGGRTLPSRISP